VSVEVVAHRGASGAAPENTLAAFRRAVDMGAHMIELDVQLSRDGEVVVLHDESVDRTTDGNGRVEDLDFDAMRRLDAGSWFDPAFSSERIPSLSEVLHEIRLPLNVELKAGGGVALAGRVLDTVRQAGAVDRIVFSSFDDGILTSLRALDPAVALAVLRSRGTIGHALEVAKRVSATALHLRNTRAWLRELRSAHVEGYHIRVWTVNNPEEWTSFEAAGATGAFTDHPDRFLQFFPA
jgi:glycerophosphoryl diester phosphodiesterase